MDFRVINTKQRIQDGFLKCLTQKQLTELTNLEIIQQAEVSQRTFYQYFAGKLDVLKTIEVELLDKLEAALIKDRPNNLQTANRTNIQLIEHELVKNNFSATIEFCDQHKGVIRPLISEHGDINFLQMIYRQAHQELLTRRKQLLTQLDHNQHIFKGMPLGMIINHYLQTLINALTYWIKNDDVISKAQLKDTLSLLQITSPIEQIKLSFKALEQGANGKINNWD